MASLFAARLRQEGSFPHLFFLAHLDAQRAHGVAGLPKNTDALLHVFTTS
jgi:hypothetical protein